MRDLRYIAVLLLGCAGGHAGTASLESELARASREFFEASGLPGLAVGVVANGEVVYRAGFGTSHLGNGQPVGPGTLFHMASITKPFVATAVQQLVEAGTVDLDRPVSAYLPEFRPRGIGAETITVRQVLTHVSGLPDVTDYAWDRPEYDDGALGRWVAGLSDSSLIAAPGERWAYSNIGYEVLAHLVARTAGESFETYVARRIFEPLGMRASTLLMTDLDSTRLAWGHERDSSGTHVPAPVYPYNRRHAGSSTLHSNVDDMLRWARANLDRGALDGARLLASGSYDHLWNEERDITDALLVRARQAGIDLPYDRMGMGLSWFLPARGGRRLVWHSGGDLGFRTDLMLYPEGRAAVVVMANGTADVRHLTVDLLDRVLAIAELDAH